MPHARAKIQFSSVGEATEFVTRLNREYPSGRYHIENFDGSSRINARSIFGVIYAMSEHGDDMFFVNEVNDEIPFFIDEYRD